MATIDDRLNRLERVFEAIANAWSASGPTSTTAPQGVDTSTSFIRKMQAFAATLDPSEQQSLAVLLAAAAAAGKQVAAQPITDQQRAASSFLRALDVKLADGAGSTGTVLEITPITLTTTVTVAASHPWITC